MPSKKVTYDNIKFDSQTEGEFYLNPIKGWFLAKYIEGLEFQPELTIKINGKVPMEYTADFKFKVVKDFQYAGLKFGVGELVVIDVKGAAYYKKRKSDGTYSYKTPQGHAYFKARWRCAMAMYPEVDRWIRVYDDQVVEGNGRIKRR